VVGELGEEKIDIISWSEDELLYVANALAPASVIDIEGDTEKKEAKVIVADDQLSLAIGKEGQNARLAAKLTGWKIDISGTGENENIVQEEEENQEDDGFAPIDSLQSDSPEEPKSEE
jgi:N utilization substance protein A